MGGYPTGPLDLFFQGLVHRHVVDNPRFVRRDWLATSLAEQLRDPARRFLLITGEPGVGKSAFMSQLAHDNASWLRYFIRENQQQVLADVSAKSFLLRIGLQLAALHPELFSMEELQLSVALRVGEVSEGGEVVGVEVKRLFALPFYTKGLEKALGIDVDVGANRGRVVAIQVDELVADAHLLKPADLLHLGLVDPARALLRKDPQRQIVILLDAVDEIAYHAGGDDILTFLTDCAELPENVRVVLSSRPPDAAVRLFCKKQGSRVASLVIAADDPMVVGDVKGYVKAFVAEPLLAERLAKTDGGAAAFARKAIAKASGNLGYLDALARGVDQALATSAEETLRALLALDELPSDLRELYAFFLDQIMTAVGRERVELRDPQSGERYDKAVWPSVYHPVLGVLAVAMEPLDIDHLIRLGDIRAEQIWVRMALDRLVQFLDEADGQYRLYHATVGEFLTAQTTRDRSSYAVFYQDAVQLHRAIATHYWSRYANDWTGCTDTYALSHLARHLVAAGDAERLRSLISKTWMLARRTGVGQTLQGFADDVALVTQAELSNASPSSEVLARLQLAKVLVFEAAGTYGDAYLTALVALNRTGEAVALARMRTDRGERYQGMLTVYRAITSLLTQRASETASSHDETSLRDELERAARADEEPIARGLALAELATAFAPCYPDGSARLFRDAIDAVASVDEDRRVYAWRSVASFLADAHDSRAEAIFERAVQAAGRNRDSLQQLADSASHPGLSAFLPKLVDAAKRLESADDANYILSWICHACIKTERLDAAEAAIGEMRRTIDMGSWSASEEVRALCSLARALTEREPERARALLRRAEAVVSGDRNSIARSAGLGEIGALLATLGDAHADELFDAAEEAANDPRMPPFNRQMTRSRLVPHLAQAGRDERARGLAATVHESSLKYEMMPSLVSAYLASRRFDLAEKTAHGIVSHSSRDNQLRHVCETLVRAGMFDDAQRVAMSMDSAALGRAETIAGVIEGLVRERRFDQAVTLAQSLPVAQSSAGALASLAAHLARAADPRAPELLTRSAEASAEAQVQAVASEHDDALLTVVRTLARLAEYEGALGVVRLVEGWDTKLNAYFAVIEAVRPSNAAVAESIVAEAERLLEAPIHERRMRFFQDIAQGDRSHVDRNVEKTRSRRMRILAERLMAAGYLERAHDLAKSIPRLEDRADTLGKVAAAGVAAGSRLGGVAIRDARRAAEALNSRRYLAGLLTSVVSEIADTLAPPAGHVRDALRSIRDAEEDPNRKVELLCKIALAVQRNSKRARSICKEAWEIARTADDTWDHSMATVARTFGAIGDHSSARQVLNEVRNPSTRDWAMADLVVGFVREDELARVRSSLTHVDAQPRAYALAHVAAELASVASPEADEIFQEAEQAATSIADADARSRALAEVVNSLVRAHLLARAEALTATIQKPDTRDDALESIASTYARASQSTEAFRTLGSWDSGLRPYQRSRIDACIRVIAPWAESLEHTQAGSGFQALRTMSDTATWLRADWTRVNAIIASSARNLA